MNLPFNNVLMHRLSVPDASMWHSASSGPRCNCNDWNTNHICLGQRCIGLSKPTKNYLNCSWITAATFRPWPFWPKAGQPVVRIFRKRTGLRLRVRVKPFLTFSFYSYDIKIYRVTWAAPADGRGGGQLPPVPCPGCPQSSWEKNYMCPLDPSRPLSQRKVYVKIHEMCQNTAQWKLN